MVPALGELGFVVLAMRNTDRKTASSETTSVRKVGDAWERRAYKDPTAEENGVGDGKGCAAAN